MAEATSNFRLEDRYELVAGRINLTGIQAIARGVLDAARRDRLAGRRVGTFVSGYPGSPLGGMEGTFRSLGPLLAEYDVVLQPGVNEELAATAVLGATKRQPYASGGYDGVTGIWYGKCNGVDRCVDVFKYGTYGGLGQGNAAVVLAGDDANVKSSGIPGESEHTLAAAGIPVLYPATVGEVHIHLLHAIEMSRASGCWVGLKLATDLCDGAATIEVDPARFHPIIPAPPAGFARFDNYFWFGEPILDGEESLFGPRHEMVRRYARANELDRVEVGTGHDEVAVIAAGKTFTDMRQALIDVGFGDAQLQSRGIRLIKVGLIYPLDAHQIISLLGDVRRVLVVEEKRGIIEPSLRSALYDRHHRPVVVGKRDEKGDPLVPIRGELDPDLLKPIIRNALGLDAAASAERRTIPVATPPGGLRRTPNYCSGCPHSRATVTPSGEVTLGGIGCHSIGLFMTQPERRYAFNVQMGGEGAPWIGAAPFVETDHVIQNLGDGTYYHSASQAIRACVEADVNITFRLLYNGHISMTGGQDIPGTRGVSALTRELESIGVRETVVVSERPHELENLAGNARLVPEHELVGAVQELSGRPGVTVLLHDRECALERRRRWRHGASPPRERLAINPRVCEGCGDCGAKSNCPSLEPINTEYGRKTRIQQSSCAVDRACLEGDCPSFVGIEVSDSSESRRRHPPDISSSALPEPDIRPDSAIYSVGIGGTGVSTVTAILSQAALMEGLWTVSLDQTGLAQKGGPIATHLQTSRAADQLRGNRIGEGGADLLLAFDLVEATQPRCLTRVSTQRTAVVADTSLTPTGEQIRDVAVPSLDSAALLDRIASATTDVVSLPARDLAESLFGDHMKANLITLGAASQAGLLPVAPATIEAAIELNKVEVGSNQLAFRYGRRWVVDREGVESLLVPPPEDPLKRLRSTDRRWLEREMDRLALPADVDEITRRRAADLVDYADRRYATDYLATVEEVAVEERRRSSEAGEFTRAVAHYLHKLLAYKDEYEVARLYLDPRWRRDVAAEYGPGAHLYYYLHPPLLRALGIRRKIRVGQWFGLAFRGLRAARRLRGSALDPFGHTRLRRLERSLPDWYRTQLRLALEKEPDSTALAQQIAELPERIRGYEHVKERNVEGVLGEADVILGRTSEHSDA